MNKSSQPEAEGVLFPPGPKNDRSTNEASKLIFAAAASAIGDESLRKEILEETQWRFRYNKHILKHVQSCLKSTEAALNAAKAGLDYMHNNFEFARDGKLYKLSEAMKTFQGSYYKGFLKGSEPKPENFKLVVPYKNKQLADDALLRQLQKWASYGTIEDSAAASIRAVAERPKWLDLSDRYFVLLGAGSAMGPFSVLMSLGANVIAIDLDRPSIWNRLLNIAKNSCGTLIFPLKKPQNEIQSEEELCNQAGADLITRCPEIANWLVSDEIYPRKPPIVGSYVYLDGDRHVKVNLACDAIIERMIAKSKQKNDPLTLAFLCTPTDVHVIPSDARRAAEANYHSFGWRNLLLLPLRAFSGRKILVKNALPPIASDRGSGKELCLVDGLVVAQGPNYALAKRMQHWRAILARDQGCIVSSHVAPSTSTASVVHNRQFAWGYDGMPYFVPFEIFEQQTSNAVMTAILINDLNDPRTVAHPNIALENPLALFREAAFHGGVWRAGYKVGSIGEVSVLVHFVKVVLRPLVVLLLVVLVSFLWRRFHHLVLSEAAELMSMVYCSWLPASLR